jgi:hypothetical protein
VLELPEPCKQDLYRQCKSCKQIAASTIGHTLLLLLLEVVLLLLLLSLSCVLVRVRRTSVTLSLLHLLGLLSLHLLSLLLLKLLLLKLRLLLRKLLLLLSLDSCGSLRGSSSNAWG